MTQIVRSSGVYRILQKGRNSFVIGSDPNALYLREASDEYGGQYFIEFEAVA